MMKREEVLKLTAYIRGQVVIKKFYFDAKLAVSHMHISICKKSETAVDDMQFGCKLCSYNVFAVSISSFNDYFDIYS